MSLIILRVPLRHVYANNNTYKNCLGFLIRKQWVHSAGRLGQKSPETELCRQLKGKIRFTGPITVSEYMKEALTNPTAGYYMNRDVFGSKGDFITSPEISQMFGEIIGIWCVSEWMEHGSPKHLQVVELGPGRGTLADDMLRVFSQFEGIKDAVSLHLVEVSPTLSKIQKQKLCAEEIKDSSKFSDNSSSSVGHYDCIESKYGPSVHWYKSLQDVPKGFTFFVAHEFFDALPINKFQKQDGKWHEVLVDIDETADGPHHFRYVLSPTETVAQALLFKPNPSDAREHIELCTEGGVIIQEIAARIEKHNGFGLIADYGHAADKTDTFRGFKNHQLHEVLAEPGTADLTADVDFSYLRNLVQNKLLTYGPVSQQSFLQNMGINVRMQVLMGNMTTSEQRKNLVTGYDMLVNPKKMGERFKFLGLLKSRDNIDKNYVPAGFKLAV